MRWVKICMRYVTLMFEEENLKLGEKVRINFGSVVSFLWQEGVFTFFRRAAAICMCVHTTQRSVFL